MKYLHHFAIVNSKETANLDLDPKYDTVIYEVIRILEGIPLFVESHLTRLQNSSRLSDKMLPFSNSHFIGFINNLITLNQVFTGNIKISLYFNNNAPDLKHWEIGYIPHVYPSAEEYTTGVKVISSQNQRLNPNAKVQNDLLRSELNKLIQQEQAYEAVLINPEGNITEGSRSNIFFVKGQNVYTAPDKEVLPGIARQNAITICRENNFELILQSVSYAELHQVDGAFITGTSPRVLPVKSIDSFTFKLPNPVTEKIKVLYNEFIFSYITSHQKNT